MSSNGTYETSYGSRSRPHESGNLKPQGMSSHDPSGYESMTLNSYGSQYIDVNDHGPNPKDFQHERKNRNDGMDHANHSSYEADQWDQDNVKSASKRRDSERNNKKHSKKENRRDSKKDSKRNSKRNSKKENKRRSRRNSKNEKSKRKQDSTFDDDDSYSNVDHLEQSPGREPKTERKEFVADDDTVVMNRKRNLMHERQKAMPSNFVGNLITQNPLLACLGAPLIPCLMCYNRFTMYQYTKQHQEPDDEEHEVVIPKRMTQVRIPS